MGNIYVASSWRNCYQAIVVEVLRGEGHTVYDFRHPTPENEGFAWSEIDPAWLAWSPAVFRQALSDPLAVQGVTCDREALHACDICVLVLPSGRSAHLEAGYAAGAGKPVICSPEELEG